MSIVIQLLPKCGRELYDNDKTLRRETVLGSVNLFCQSFITPHNLNCPFKISNVNCCLLNLYNNGKTLREETMFGSVRIELILHHFKHLEKPI